MRLEHIKTVYFLTRCLRKMNKKKDRGKAVTAVDVRIVYYVHCAGAATRKAVLSQASWNLVEHKYLPRLLAAGYLECGSDNLYRCTADGVALLEEYCTLLRRARMDRIPAMTKKQ